MGVTDCHVHINPIWEMLPEVRGRVQREGEASHIEEYLRDPKAFLAYLDRAGVERAVLVNYIAPEIIGYTEKTNDFVLEYAKADLDRLLAVGSVLPSHTDPGAEVDRLARAGLRGLKMHPSHQLYSPNDYLDGTQPGLRAIYEALERWRLPLLVHTGTSVFPGARNRFANPLHVEDVAIDFPRLTIVLAHGGRPFWTEEAVFLTRRFPNVFLEISSIPPLRILKYFPELERIADQVLFGSDWPGPGVSDLGANLRAFRELPFSGDTMERILIRNPERVFPRRSG